MSSVIVFPEPGKVELQQVELPELADGQVKLRSRVSLLSTGTEGIVFGARFAPDTHFAKWFRYPHRAGYSMVADVVESRDPSLSAGDRVVVMAPHGSEHVVDANHCTPVREEVSDDDAAWFALAKVAYVGAEAADARLGAKAMVIGAGPVGQMATRWLAAAGSGSITVVDRSPGPRHEIALAGGATGAIHADLAAIDAVDIERPDVVIDSTGNAAVFEQALRIVADRGRVVVLGDTGFPAEQRLTPDLIVRGLTVVGAHGNHARGERAHEVIRLYFQLVAEGRFATRGLATHRFAPAQCANAYELTEKDRNSTMGIYFDWSTT